jgi:hypothetical protein
MFLLFNYRRVLFQAKGLHYNLFNPLLGCPSTSGRPRKKLPETKSSNNLILRRVYFVPKFENPCFSKTPHFCGPIGPKGRLR